MTFPVATIDQLRGAMWRIPGVTPLSVRDSHGNPMELAGVEPQLNDAEEIVGFVLVVAQKEKKP